MPDARPGGDPSSLPELAASLACLVAPIDAGVFRERYWRQEVFFCPGAAGRLRPVLQELGSLEIAPLLWQSQHYVVLGPEAALVRAGRPSMAVVLEAYRERGGTLYMRMKNTWALARWTAALADELGEPPIGVTSLFAVRAGGGTKPHLDWNDNFTIQLVGTKRWQVARNDFVANPITNWNVGDPAPLYGHSTQLPTAMPAEAQEYYLTPGSVLYVPRGFLHHVTSTDDADSLSLNMSLPPSPWAVILTNLLSHRLLQDAAFREGLRGAFGSGWGQDQVLDLLPLKLAAMSRHVGELGADLADIMRDPAKLREFLARRIHPRY